MALRKWLVRGLVLAVLGGLVFIALLYQAWTSPAAVRAQLLGKLRARFVGATVGIEWARLRLLGGIAVGEVRLARRDGLDSRDFAYVPAGVLYHDKEHLLEGIFGLRKMVLERPVLRLVRERDGSCNWQGILGPVDLRERVPTLVIQQGTLLLEDRAFPGAPVLEVRDLNLTAVNNDPMVIEVEGAGRTDVAGPVRLRGRFRRDTGEAAATIQLPAVPVGPALVQRLAHFRPELAAHLRQLSGTGQLRASLAYAPGDGGGLHYDAAVSLAGGEFAHAQLPIPLAGLEASARVADGRVAQARASAELRCDHPDGPPPRFELAVRDATFAGEVAGCLEELAREGEYRIDHLPITAELLDAVPDALRPLAREVNEDYAPRGPVSLALAFRREGGQLRRAWAVRPEGIRGRFRAFPYPLEDVTGTVEGHAGGGDDRVTVHVTGRASGRPVKVDGEARGPKGASEVAFEIEADDVPLDDKIFDALPARSQQLARQFLPERSRREGLRAAPMGRGDVRATVRRPGGQKAFANRYVVTFKDAALQYDQFPLPLEGVSGVLDLLPDHWECRGFRGTHGAGEVRVDGRSYPLPPAPAPAAAGEAAPRPERVAVAIQGRDVPMDAEFVRALAPPGMPGRAALQAAWKTLALAGNISFRADVEEQPDQPQDLDVAVAVRSCTLRPAFFPYPMEEVSGTVRYARDRVVLRDVRARHGAGVLGVKSGEVVLLPAGGFYCKLDSVHGGNLEPDAALREALPRPLRRGLEALELRDPVTVETDLIVKVPAGPGGPAVVWWDGGAVLHGAGFKAGVDLSKVDGRVHCCGRHNGQQLDGVVGNVLLEQATVFGQPVRNLHARLEVAPESPDVLRVRDVKAELFGGSLGGEGRVEFGPPLRYEAVLRAVGVQLEQFGRHNNLGPDADLQGPATGSLALRGEGADIGGLRGNGRMDVARGKLYRLPPLMNLLKAFGLRAPDRTAFEEAHVEFEVEGPQARVRRLELFGNAVSLRGQGSLNLDGSDLNLDFNADWGRLGQVLPAAVGEIPRAISDQLLRIKVRGKVGEPRYDKELVPGVVEPLRRAFGPTGS
jgi:hypothetical protein